MFRSGVHALRTHGGMARDVISLSFLIRRAHLGYLQLPLPNDRHEPRETLRPCPAE